MEGSCEPVSGPNEQIKIPNESKGPGRKWPVWLTGLGLTLALLSSISEWFPQLIGNSYFIILTIEYISPLLFVLGVVFMYVDRNEGKIEIIKFSTLGGVTLIVCTVSSLPVYYEYLSLLFASNGTAYSVLGGGDYNNFYNLLRLLQTIGIVASIIGAYYALRRQSFIRALVGSGLSIFLLGSLISPLAMAVIALGSEDFPRKERPSIINQPEDLT